MNLKSLMSTTAVFTVAMIITIFNVASATEHVIATVSSDDNEKVYKLIVEAEDGRTIKTFYKDVYEKGKKTKREVLDPKVIKSGLILEKRDKYEVMKLQSPNFDLEQGGVMYLDTLYNGAVGERRSYEVEVAQSKHGWAIFNKGKTIKDIKIQTNRIVMLGAVGIKNLIMN